MREAVFGKAANENRLPRRRALVIFNPTAGRRNRAKLAQVVEVLGAEGTAVTVRETQAAGDARRIAGEVSCRDTDVVIAAGGDGTLNEVVNGRSEEGPPVGLIPLGTANVAALELGLGQSSSAIARAIGYGPVRPLWCGEIAGRKFLLMAGVGFDAHVVGGVSMPIKRLIGKGAYVAESGVQLWRYGFPAFEADIDGQRITVASMVISNARYYGGPFTCAAAASFTEPGFHVGLFQHPGRLHVLRYALALTRGRLEESRGYRVVKAQRVILLGPAGEPVQIDGEIGPSLPVEVTVSSTAIPFVHPLPEQ